MCYSIQYSAEVKLTFVLLCVFSGCCSIHTIIHDSHKLGSRNPSPCRQLCTSRRFHVRIFAWIRITLTSSFWVERAYSTSTRSTCEDKIPTSPNGLIYHFPRTSYSRVRPFIYLFIFRHFIRKHGNPLPTNITKYYTTGCMYNQTEILLRNFTSKLVNFTSKLEI